MLELLTIFVIFLQYMEMGFFTHMLLIPKYSFGRCMTAWLGFALSGALLRFYLYDGVYLQLFSVSFSTILWLSIMRYFYKDRLWKRIVAICVLFAASLMGEIVINLVFMVGGMTDYNLNGVSYERLIVLISSCILVAVIMTGFLRVWATLINHEKSPGLIVVLLQLVFQFCMLIGAEFPIWGLGISTYERSVYCEAGEILACICLVYWLYWMVSKSHQSELQTAVRDMEEQLNREHAYYHALEHKREALAKLRHDMNNQIQATKYLIESGDEMEAEALLEELSGVLESMK